MEQDDAYSYISQQRKLWLDSILALEHTHMPHNNLYMNLLKNRPFNKPDSSMFYIKPKQYKLTFEFDQSGNILSTQRKPHFPNLLEPQNPMTANTNPNQTPFCPDLFTADMDDWRRIVDLNQTFAEVTRYITFVEHTTVKNGVYCISILDCSHPGLLLAEITIKTSTLRMNPTHLGVQRMLDVLEFQTEIVPALAEWAMRFYRHGQKTYPVPGLAIEQEDKDA